MKVPFKYKRLNSPYLDASDNWDSISVENSIHGVEFLDAMKEKLKFIYYCRNLKFKIVKKDNGKKLKMFVYIPDGLKV